MNDHPWLQPFYNSIDREAILEWRVNTLAKLTANADAVNAEVRTHNVKVSAVFRACLTSTKPTRTRFADREGVGLTTTSLSRSFVVRS